MTTDRTSTPANVLGEDPRPRFFAFEDPSRFELAPPGARRDVAVRTFVRSLEGMQKEALVVSSASGRGWRLTSDEGPYLAGYDEAPFPLAFLDAGMVASYANEVTALAAQRGIALPGLRLTLDNHYTMEGSAVRGTMVGGALAPELTIEVEAGADQAALRSLGADAIDASPLNGLLRGQLESLFTLTHNGEPLEPSRVAALEGAALPDAEDRYDEIAVDGPPEAPELMRRTGSAELHEGDGGSNSSLRAEQKRALHVRGVCTVRADGVKVIDVQLLEPSGSRFRFLSDEPVGAGGQGLAPDAATLISAGIAFCFMTQFGRYAAITKKRLGRYRIIQDTHVSLGGASGGTGLAGGADPVETHVHLESQEDDEFARTLLDMGEQTCFLHALCRTDLKTRLRWSSTVAVPAAGA
ncbi:OsmC family protein [Blastococcus saxobsidens]|uniref:Organic hydroperoxide reductase OsmC/OhrA n=1 Tax=Blastococcus saxobsidens TaxID=138336 RepID=A0A4V2G1W1_9ACTN|nr:OsmC family protein [Blastococcus saxobsidens]RZU30796.1 organic hydroperoxide reductase OsmC/OhrA [Blastococcus saxobsidens]